MSLKATSRSLASRGCRLAPLARPGILPSLPGPASGSARFDRLEKGMGARFGFRNPLPTKLTRRRTDPRPGSDDGKGSLQGRDLGRAQGAGRDRRVRGDVAVVRKLAFSGNAPAAW